MIDPARPPAVSRRQFLALSAALASIPVLGGCASDTAAAGGRAPSGGAARVIEARAENSIRTQVTTPLPLVPFWARAMGLATRDLPAGSPDHLLVLSYHNVTADGYEQATGRPDHYTVSAQAFAAQMQMLRLSGFETVRLNDVLDAHTRGVPLPPRSLLITFDDGGAGQWIYADRVLANIGFTAVAFLITGHLGSAPSYLSWAEAQALARTGRWEVGAHTHDMHHFVPTGPLSPRASVLINRIWDPATRALEPLEVAEARIKADLATSLGLLKRNGFPTPRAFAYPFSQIDEPTNDGAFPAQVNGLLAATFKLRMANTSPGRIAQPEDLRSGVLPRLEVQHRTSALSLFDKIRCADIPVGPEQQAGERAGG